MIIILLQIMVVVRQICQRNFENNAGIIGQILIYAALNDVQYL